MLQVYKKWYHVNYHNLGNNYTMVQLKLLKE